jgi:hypothetical protein
MRVQKSPFVLFGVNVAATLAVVVINFDSMVADVPPNPNVDPEEA